MLGGLAATSLVVAACTGGGDPETAAPGARRASGPPIVVGLVNMENAPVGSFPELRQDAQAAVRYVNEELGGVRGRPLHLEVCTTTGAPESSNDCARKLVGKQPVAVLGGVDVGAGLAMTVFEKAGIPYVGATPTSLQELTSPMSFMLAGGSATELLGQAEYIIGTLKAKKVGVIHVDLAGLLSTEAAAARTILERKGVTGVKVVAEKADTADFTPALTAVNAAHPDVIVTVFPAQGCSRIMQARQALGVKAKMFYLGACTEQRVVDAAGGGAEGAYFASSYIPYEDATDEDVATYRAQRRRYGDPGAPLSLLGQTGFSVVMDLYRLLTDVEDPLTPDRVTAELRAARDRPSFMGHPYSCDGERVPLLASLCSVDVRILQYRGGRFHDVVGRWVSGAEIIKVVTGG